MTRFKTDENLHPSLAARLCTLGHECRDRTYSPEAYSGILVLRLRDQSRASVERVVDRVLAVLATSEIAGQLWVVDEHSIRVREEPPAGTAP